MQFDTTTILFAICTIMAVLGLQILFFWSRDRRSPWLGWYAATFLLASAVLPGYLFPAAGREFLIFGVGNALRIAAIGFMWQGTRLFGGRAPEQSVLLLCCAVWLTLCSFPWFIDNMNARVVVSSGFIALFCFLAAWELWRDRAEALPSRLPTIAVYLSFGAIAALRMPLVGLLPFPMGGRPLDPVWLGGFGLVVFAHASFLVALTVSMTRERHELEQRRFALSDPLTGLLNRRAYDDYVQQLGRRRADGQDDTAVLVLDLDDFKSINDRYGHDAGDQVLQRFADIARQSTRAADQLYRMGGEEFCFILAGTSMVEAHAVAERIRVRFSDASVLIGNEPIRATVSIGVAVGGSSAIDLDGLVAAGDGAAYEAKARGRNLVVVAQTMPTRLAAPTAA